MKAFAIFFTIVCAWISGVGIAHEEPDDHEHEIVARDGAVIAILLAVAFGVMAWLL